MSNNQRQQYDYEALPLPKLTPSGVGDLHCPRKFWQLRIKKNWPARAPRSYGAFGDALHRCLRNLYSSRGDLPDLDMIEIYVRAAMIKLRYASSDAKAADANRLCRMLFGYIEQDIESDIEAVRGTIAVERLCQDRILHGGKPFCILSATIDRLIVRGSEPTTLICRDYKTSAPDLDLEEAYVMLWAAKKVFGSKYEQYRLELDFVDEGGRFDRVTVTPSDCRGIHDGIVARLLEQLESIEHPETPDERACRWCPLISTCSAISGQGSELTNPPFGEDES